MAKHPTDHGHGICIVRDQSTRTPMTTGLCKRAALPVAAAKVPQAVLTKSLHADLVGV